MANLVIVCFRWRGPLPATIRWLLVDAQLPYLVMVSLRRTFEASPPDYSSIQSELDHWKNLTFSFDMSDEQPSKSSSQPPSSSDRVQSHDSSETKVSRWPFF